MKMQMVVGQNRLWTLDLGLDFGPWTLDLVGRFVLLNAPDIQDREAHL